MQACPEEEHTTGALPTASPDAHLAIPLLRPRWNDLGACDRTRMDTDDSALLLPCFAHLREGPVRSLTFFISPFMCSVSLLNIA